MQVAFVISQDSGGLPHYGAELANAVSEHAEVTVFKPNDTSADDLFSDDLTLVDSFRPTHLSLSEFRQGGFSPIQTLLGLASYWRLRQIRDYDPDVVHVVTNLFPQVQLFSWLYRLDTEYPFVLTIHGVRPGSVADDTNVLNVGARILNRALPSLDVDRTIVHTEQNKKTLIDRGEPPQSIHVIPHGVYESFAEYDHSDVTEDPRNALFFGNIVEDKGIGTILEALPLIVDQIPDFTLSIAGKGTISSEHQDVLTEYEENIELTNKFVPNEEVGHYFQRSSLVVIPHRRQTGHSGTLTVAYSFGKPVVATDVGDFDRLVAESGAGRVVPPDDPESLADAVVEILTDESRRIQMCRASEVMADELSWRSIAERHVDVYEGIVHSTQEGPCGSAPAGSGPSDLSR